MDKFQEQYADMARPALERKYGMDGEVIKLDGVNPQMPSYSMPAEHRLVGWDTATNAMDITISRKEIKIETYKVRQQYEDFADTLTIRKDELGNILYKKWDRHFNNKPEDTKMNITTGDYVVYIKNRDISVIGSTRKDIWKVKRVWGSSVDLESISKDGKGFTTDIGNVVTVKYVADRNLFKREYFNETAFDRFRNRKVSRDERFNQEYEAKFNVEKDMNSNNNAIKRATNANVDAAKVAATITAGKTLNNLVASKVTPQLPIFVKGYADTAVGRVVIANLADFAVKQFMANNRKANMATDAMMQAAMLELADSFDLEGIVTELVDSVALEVPAE